MAEFSSICLIKRIFHLIHISPLFRLHSPSSRVVLLFTIQLFLFLPSSLLGFPITSTNAAFIEPSEHSKSFSGKFVIYDDFDRQMIESSVEPIHSIGPVAFAVAPPMSTATLHSTSFSSSRSSKSHSELEPLKPLESQHELMSHSLEDNAKESAAESVSQSAIAWNDEPTSMNESEDDQAKPAALQLTKQVHSNSLSNLLIKLPPPQPKFQPQQTSSAMSSSISSTHFNQAGKSMTGLFLVCSMKYNFELVKRKEKLV